MVYVYIQSIIISNSVFIKTFLVVDISKLLRNYLAENPSITVPGLGRFTAVDKPSEIKGDVVFPPVRTVAYDSSSDEDDGVLTAYIAQQENISLEQAKNEATEFYNRLKNKLSNRQPIALDRFGTLDVNTVGDIVFTPDAELFIERHDAYGLGQVNLQGGQVDRPEPAPVIVEPVTPVISASSEKSTVEPQVTSTPVHPQPSSVKGSLFASEKVRVRENTERSRTVNERHASPVKPVRPSITASPTTQKKQKSVKQKKIDTSSNGFPMWVLLVLLIAGGLGVGFYFLYPKLSPYVDSAISSIKDGGTDQVISEEQTSAPLPETTTAMPENPEVAQALDQSTDKKNALNPAEETSKSGTDFPASATNKPVAMQPAQSGTAASTRGSVGQGKYVLVVGSFTTQTRAEKFGKLLQNAGINYEIIDFGNERVRVAVTSSNDKTEALRQVEQFKSKPHCQGVWIAVR